MSNLLEELKKQRLSVALAAGTAIAPISTSAATPFSLLPPSERNVTLLVVEPSNPISVLAHDHASFQAATNAAHFAASHMQSASLPNIRLADNDISEDTQLTSGRGKLGWMKDADIISMSYSPIFHQISIKEGAETLNNTFGGLIFKAEGNQGREGTNSNAQAEPFWSVGMYKYKVGVGQGEILTNGVPVAKSFTSRSAPSFLYPSPFSERTQGKTADALRSVDDVVKAYEEKYPLDLKYLPQRKLTFRAKDLADAEYDKLPEKDRPKFGDIFDKHHDALKKRFDQDAAFRAEIEQEVRDEHEKVKSELRKQSDESIAELRKKGHIAPNGEITELHGTSFAAPTAAGDAAQLKKQFGLGNHDIMAVMCLSTVPVHQVEGSDEKINHVTTSSGRLYDPLRSGWGMVDRQALYKNAEELSRLKRDHDLREEEVQIRSKGTIRPSKTSFSKSLASEYSGIKNGHHVFTLACDQSGSLVNSQIVIDYEDKGGGALGAYVTSPSGVRIFVPGSTGNHFPTPKVSEEQVNDIVIKRTTWDEAYPRTIINTDAFLGENPKGTWTIEVSDAHKPTVATMDINGAKKGTYLDKFIREKQRGLDAGKNHGEQASHETNVPGSRWQSHALRTKESGERHK